MTRSRLLALGVLALAAGLPAARLLGSETKSNRLTILSTTDVIDELSPCG